MYYMGGWEVYLDFNRPLTGSLMFAFHREM